MDIKRGDIWYVESGFTTGSEQRPGRPAVVVSNDKNNEYSSTIEVVYLTTQPKRDLPTHALITSMGRDSTAICEQVTTVAVERFGNYRGAVTPQEMADIDEAMLISLGLDYLLSTDDVDEDDEWERETPPTPVAEDVSALAAKLAEAEAKNALLQTMYDNLLTKVLKAG